MKDIKKEQKLVEKIRSLMTRWGYELIHDRDSPYSETPYWEKEGCLQVPFKNHKGLPLDLFLYEITYAIAKNQGLRYEDADRLIRAEPTERNLGTIVLKSQPQTEWGEPEDHAAAEIRLDNCGRDRLIAALIEGRDSIEVYGESGGGYSLRLVLE
jgi:hypothetical protein